MINILYTKKILIKMNQKNKIMKFNIKMNILINKIKIHSIYRKKN